MNLVDFDMKYGHRNDVAGYAAAMHEWDDALGIILDKMNPDDLLIITADHGCDPGDGSTDHSREDVPLLIYSPTAKPESLGKIRGFGYVATRVKNFLEN